MPRPRRPGRVAPLALALGALCVVGATGCNPKVIGNGVWAEAQYAAPPFDRVDVSLGFRATVQVVSGPGATRSVTYSGDENALPHITFTVVDGTLTVSSDVPVDSVNPLTVRIVTLELAGVEAHELSTVSASGVVASPFTVRAVEGSRVNVSGDPGAGAALSATLETGAVLDAHAFPVAAADLSLSSHSEATVHSTGPVTGSASGGSWVSVAGGGTCALTLSPPPAASACVEAPAEP